MLRDLKQELEDKRSLLEKDAKEEFLEYSELIRLETEEEMLQRFIAGIELEITDLIQFASDHNDEIDGYFNDKEMTEHDSDKVMIAKFNEILGNEE